MQPDSKTEPIGAVETTLSVIETLKKRGECGVTEVANILDLPSSTVHSHLNTLEQNQYVLKDGETYKLSLRPLEIGEIARNRYELFEVAAPEVDDLAEETGEIASIMVEEHGKGVFLYRAEGEQTVKLDSYAGYRTYLHTTALGKAILAFLPEDRLEWIVRQQELPRRTANTITDRDALRSELEEIRNRNVAFDDEERVRGFRAVAAPIVDEDRNSVGSISLAGPTRRLEGETYQADFPAKVQQAANVIELNLTHG
jgi:DNA-binding IclR family transcriptional regulator